MLILIAALALAQDGAAERVKTHVEALRAESLQERAIAAETLAAMGEPALAPLRACAEREKDADVRARLAEIVAQIEKAVAQAKVCRAAKPVTIAAKDRPLDEVVRDLCGQAGVECSVESSVARRTVTLAADRQPLLQALDALCGDAVTWETRDGRVHFSAGRHAAIPSAYGDVFRLRLKRVVSVTTQTPGGTSSTLVVNLVPDAEPGIVFRGATLEVTARGPGGDLALKSVSEMRVTSTMMSGDRGWMIADEIAVPWDADHPIETARMIKDVPGDLRKFESIRVKGTFRFAGKTRTVSCKAAMNGTQVTLPGTPITLSYNGNTVRLSTTDGSAVSSVGDIDSLVAVDASGGEHRFRQMGVPRQNFVQLYSQALRDREVEFKMTVMADFFDRAVSFEMKDVEIKR